MRRDDAVYRPVIADVAVIEGWHGSRRLANCACNCKAATKMTVNQSIVWIDDKEARILSVESGLHHESTIHAPAEQVSPKQPARIGDTIDDSHSYFFQVARALDWADEILIVGPSTTKVEFLKYMHKDDHAIDPRILGVETIAYPTDIELQGFAKLYFTVGGPRRILPGS
jgi:hypothetical protein